MTACIDSLPQATTFICHLHLHKNTDHVGACKHREKDIGEGFMGRGIGGGAYGEGSSADPTL